MIANPETWSDPHAPLETNLISEFLRNQGHTRKSIQRLPIEEFTRLMIEATRYASARLAEMESRARFVHTIHYET